MKVLRSAYAPRLLDELTVVLQGARRVLDCPMECQMGCSSCVLVADLFAQQELIDRRAALSFLTALLADMSEPDQDDMAGPGSVLSRPAADAMVRRVQSGDVAAIWTGSDYDLAALAEAPFSTVFGSLGTVGAEVRLVLPSGALEQMDDAARAGLRNASFRHGFTLWSADPVVGVNGAAMLAAIGAPGGANGFFTRDTGACVLGAGWGSGSEHPLVEMPLVAFPQMLRVDADALERSSAPGDRVRIIQSDPGRPVKQFGAGMISRVLKDDLEAAGLWKPGHLATIGYSDRYLKAPLPVLLMFRTVAALRDALAPKGGLIPLDIVTEPRRDDRYGDAPFKIGNNWQNEGDRADVVEALAGRLRLQCRYDNSHAPHGRKMTIRYDDGTVAVILFDQGFGYWRATSSDRHDFRAGPERQAGALLDSATFVAGVGESYVAVTRS